MEYILLSRNTPLIKILILLLCVLENVAFHIAIGQGTFRLIPILFSIFENRHLDGPFCFV